MLVRGSCRGGKYAVPAVGFLVDRHVVRESAQEIQLPFDPSEDLFRGDEYFKVTQSN